MNYKSNLFLFLMLIIASFLPLSCGEGDTPQEPDNQVCYRCIHQQMGIPICNDNLTVEACVLGPHEQSLQMILEITENCDGEITTKEEIGFIEDFLAEQEYTGAMCMEF